MSSGCRPLLGGQTGRSSSLPVLCCFHADKDSDVIIAYVQLGIVQISSYRVLPSHAREPGYCRSGGLALVTLELGPLSLVESFPEVAWIRLTMNVDESLYTKQFAEFQYRVLSKELNTPDTERAESSVGVHIFPSALKINLIKLDNWGRYLTSHSRFA